LYEYTPPLRNQAKLVYSAEYWADVECASNHVNSAEHLFGKKILITGATGMVCSAVVEILELLNKKHDAGISLYLAGRSEDRLKRRFGNEVDYKYVPFDALKSCMPDVGVDYIIHGASNSNPAAYGSEPVETLLANVIGTDSMLKLAQKNDARMLYISSSEIYGGKEGNQPYSEGDYGFVDVLNPRACYPSGKRAAETLCLCYGKEYGVDTVIVRPGHIYGPSITESDTRASAQFTRDVLAGRNICMKSAGSQLRSYCYTLDCASAILSVLISGTTGEAYNISNKQSVVSIRTFAEVLAKTAGKEIEFDNPTDAEMKSYNMMSNSSLDSTKLEALGWSACFDIERGIRRMLEAMRQV
jgi:nucleoside-diphosphate-sugar epimerase